MSPSRSGRERDADVVEERVDRVVIERAALPSAPHVA
jgi:hypothetical protein